MQFIIKGVALFLCVYLSTAFSSYAQQVGGTGVRWHRVQMTTDAGTFTIPSDVTSQVLVDGCGNGGSGAGGQASSNTAGGSGGGAASCVLQFPIGAVAGSVITVAIPTPPGGGVAGAPGTAGGTTTLTWTLGTDSGQLRALGGCAGSTGTSGTGGTGAATSFSCNALGGQAGASAGNGGVQYGTSSFAAGSLAAGFYDGPGSGGGGNTAGTGGAGGSYPGRGARTAAGSGNGAGSGGGNSFLGLGQVGSVSGTNCNVSPTWVGLGGGGCGGGSNASGGPGGPGGFIVWYQD